MVWYSQQAAMLRIDKAFQKLPVYQSRLISEPSYCSATVVVEKNNIMRTVKGKLTDMYLLKDIPAI